MALDVNRQGKCIEKVLFKDQSFFVKKKFSEIMESN